MTGSAQVIQADARSLPLADASVDLVVTSPPYFALRSYQDGGEHYDGQLGSESTPAEFVDALLDVTRECVRVLKPAGSLWLNLGDKYSGAGRGNHDSDRLNNTAEFRAARLDTLDKRQHVGKGIIPAKSLMGIPWRYALRCIDDLGLILRAEVIWSKPNGLPESVTDRVRRSHEQWFHMVLNPRYYSAVDEIREPHAPATAGRVAQGFKANGRLSNGASAGNMRLDELGDGYDELNPLGKLPGSVWVIPTEPLQVPDHLGVDHFAAFPTEWPRRIIQGWSPSGVCVECGEGRRPVSGKHTAGRPRNDAGDGGRGNRLPGYMDVQRSGWAESVSREIIGSTCACGVFNLVGMRLPVLTSTTTGNPLLTADGAVSTYDAVEGGVVQDHASVAAYALHGPTVDQAPPTEPAVVLDPFGGTGTTALVAKALGRHGISIDMSADYTRLAQWRVNDPDQLAKAARVAKPPRQVDGQIGFDLEGIA